MTDGLALVTGGAGFIGSHTVDRLLSEGYRVRVLDRLSPQVHGDVERPRHLASEAEFVRADIRDAEAVERALAGASVVYHLAAETGVGQSMYEAAAYVDVNVTGTAVLWQALARTGAALRRFVLSSSRAVYGEGSYRCVRCGVVEPGPRSEAQLAAASWHHTCPRCGRPVVPAPTRESAPTRPVSVYALTKQMQEDLCRLYARRLANPVAILRYFNVYGPRQSLANAYTGLIPTFASRLRNGKELLLYEGGAPVRDFVHVFDVVEANLRALDARVDDDEPIVVNVGSGDPTPLDELARELAAALGIGARVKRVPLYRLGDVLASVADLSRAREVLGYAPRIERAEGLRSMVQWLATEDAIDTSDDVAAELRSRGVLRG